MNANAHQSKATAGERLLRKPEVLARIGLGTTSLYAQIKAGRFPRAVSLSLGGRSVGWIESQVDGWIADRIAEAQARPSNYRRD
ncbi:AlpA family transcriptional regulator [Rhizobacter sp. Root16D2]|uniref:helix-turn-helix transcriptional regulator n=1 Tax=Rhizobacter sp. Root16D2 TaxID=1736479 RepID=UPI0006F8EEE4|nr:AlpA family phage regulatory protein [Rhizobacter sp. Root16D2]KRB14570.1 hypothetical protein ASE08_09020 [Rhizobacter sp. Root16D2]